MHRLAAVLALAVATFTTTPLAAQNSPERALATFTVTNPELEWKQWAAEPLFSNPTSMDIDHLGRVWVCEGVNYRQRLLNRPIQRPEGDRIVIVEDSTGGGSADKVTVFAQAPYIHAPLGIAVAKDPIGPGWKVYVCQSPDILLFEDKDGDGKADGEPKKFLGGFRGVDHDHGVHGILIGPDNKLYFSVGDQGVRDLQSSDGTGRKWTSNNTDCRAGTIWRRDLDGKNLELIAHNFRNEYEPCVDSFGNIFVSDNDDDGNQQTRICYVMPGGNYGYHPRGRGETHWHEEQPGVVPKILRTWFGSPTGMCMYEGTLLPKKYWGQPLHVDAGPRHVRAYHLKPQGAGFDAQREDIVTSSDTWFRPSDICVAPDGSVFVTDWYDPGVGGHGMRDINRGRIYRLAPKGHKYHVPKVDLESPRGVAEALASPNRACMYMAIKTFPALDQEKRTEVAKYALSQRANCPWVSARYFWLIKEDPNRSLEALDIEARPNLANLDWITAQEVRKLTYLYPNLTQAPEQIRNRLKNDAPRASHEVRKEVLLALRQAEPDFAKQVILPLAQKHDGQDRFYLAALGIAVGTDPKRREVILADFDKHFPTWSEKVASLVWELRPPSVMPRLEMMLTDAKLPADQRVGIVDILATEPGTAGGMQLLRALVDESSPEVRERIIANLSFLPNKWRGLGTGPDLDALIDKLLARTETTSTGLTLIAATAWSEAIPKVAALIADVRTPVAVKQEAVKTLGELPTEPAVTLLQTLMNQSELTLRVTAAQALGQHIAGGLRGGGGGGRRGNPSRQTAVDSLQEIVLNKESRSPLAVRQAALAALAGSQAGTTWLIELQTAKTLPEDIAAEAGRLARNTPFVSLRGRALTAFPSPGKLDVAKLPSPSVLAGRTGDAIRGKQVLADSAKSDLQCLKCHAVQGTGGNVGPDLSMIGKKGSRENLYESLLTPSKAIADQYVQWTVVTQAGLSLSGLLVEETADTLILRDANGKDSRITKTTIQSREKSLNSLMPENLVNTLTEDDLVNVVEYLTTLTTPALSFASWHVAGPFANGPDGAGLNRDFGPEKAIDLAATFAGKTGTVRWRTLATDAQGYVDLREYFGADSANSVAYVTRVFESPVDQDIRILLGTEGAAKIWVNNEAVVTNRRPRTAVPGEDVVAIKVPKGRNQILLKIASSDGPNGFYLTVLSAQELQLVDGGVK